MVNSSSHTRPMLPQQPAPSPGLVPPPGAALVEELDRTVMVQLGDGVKLIGVLRTVDVHGNLVLEHVKTRHVSTSMYHDEPRGGIELIRGENVVLMGRIDPEKEARMGLEHVSKEEIKKAQEDERLAAQMAGRIQRQFDFLDL